MMLSKLIKLNLLLLAAFSSYTAFSQKENKYLCPLNDGTIIIEHTDAYEYGKRIKQATIKSNDPNVLSSSSGYVFLIDTSEGSINVVVKSDSLTFSYYDLDSVNVQNGQIVKCGEVLGKIKAKGKLVVIIIGNREYLDPSQYIKCRVRNIYPK